MLGDEELALRRHDDAIVGEQTVRDMPGMELSDRRQQAAKEVNRGTRIRSKARQAGRFEHFRQALARNELRHERELCARLLEDGHLPDACIGRMPEIVERFHADAQRGLESRVRRQQRIESQQLEAGSRVVEQLQAVANPVGEAFGVPGDELAIGFTGGSVRRWRSRIPGCGRVADGRLGTAHSGSELTIWRRDGRTIVHEA